MKKHMYAVLYTTSGLLLGSSFGQDCDEIQSGYACKSQEVTHYKKPIQENGVSEELQVIWNYRDKNIVSPGDNLSHLFPFLLRLDGVLKEIPIKKVVGIDFSKNPLSDEGMKMIRDQFSQAPSLEWIDLSSIDLSLDGLKIVVDLLKNNKHIDYICVASNPAISVKSKEELRKLDVSLLRKLVLVNEEKLYTDSLHLFLKEHEQYNKGQLVDELRPNYEKFFQLKTGKTFEERYLTYDESQDPDGEKATLLAAQMEGMHRYKVAKEFYLKGIKKRNLDAAYYLAKLYSRGFLEDSNHKQYKEYLNLAINFGHPSARWEYYRVLDQEEEARQTLHSDSDDPSSSEDMSA